MRRTIELTRVNLPSRPANRIGELLSGVESGYAPYGRLLGLLTKGLGLTASTTTSGVAAALELTGLASHFVVYFKLLGKTPPLREVPSSSLELMALAAEANMLGPSAIRTRYHRGIARVTKQLAQAARLRVPTPSAPPLQPPIEPVGTLGLLTQQVKQMCKRMLPLRRSRKATSR